jgi:hypothetical protein
MENIIRAHVFVVNDNTFPIHLNYLFAGTGAGEDDENISLLCDIKRVRPGDFVIFYIEAKAKVKGGFYGVFRIKEQDPIVFHVKGQDAYKPDNLGMKLIYRTLIEPHEVYPEGVPEWEALDKLPIYATEVQWSLIYRKLKGKRGCTPLLPWEAERLINMIRDKNAGKYIADPSYTGGFTWDAENRRITLTKQRLEYPYQRNYSFDTVGRICEVMRSGKRRAFENLLQLYFIENIGFRRDLEPIVGGNVVWFGNEVACGVGMQKMDLLVINEHGGRREYRIIELKDEPVKPDVVDQIEYYVNWASQRSGRHLLDAYEWNIQPVIVAPRRNIGTWRSVVEAFRAFRRYNQKNISLPILYFEFSCRDRSIVFEEVSYS